VFPDVMADSMVERRVVNIALLAERDFGAGKTGPRKGHMLADAIGAVRKGRSCGRRMADGSRCRTMLKSQDTYGMGLYVVDT
jgi:hypothetical protein